MTKKECEHNIKALYYRKQISNGKTQGWFRVKCFVICDKCFKIMQKETKLKEIKKEENKK